jgi:curved DNA-binding protein CbpA
MSPPSESRNDPFSVLGLRQRFDLDPAEVERAFLQRVAATHPDHAADDPLGPDQGDAEVAVARLSNARETLLDAERRAVALLALLGGEDASADRSLPIGFLQEILEVREAMEADLASEGDEARPRWRAWAVARRDGHVATLQGWFRSPSPPLADIRRELNAWRYVERMMEQLDAGRGRGPA